MFYSSSMLAVLVGALGSSTPFSRLTTSLRISSNKKPSKSFQINFRNLEAFVILPSNLSSFSNPLHVSLISLMSPLFLKSSILSCRFFWNFIVTVFLSATVVVLLETIVALLALNAYYIAITLCLKIVMFALMLTLDINRAMQLLIYSLQDMLYSILN